MIEVGLPGSDPRARPGDSVPPGAVAPWMVTAAAAAIGVMALAGLASGVRNGLTNVSGDGAVLRGFAPALARSAVSATPMPADPAWSVLKGPAILPAGAASTATAEDDEDDSGADESGAAAAAAAAALSAAGPASAAAPEAPAPPPAEAPQKPAAVEEPIGA